MRLIKFRQAVCCLCFILNDFCWNTITLTRTKGVQWNVWFTGGAGLPRFTKKLPFSRKSFICSIMIIIIMNKLELWKQIMLYLSYIVRYPLDLSALYKRPGLSEYFVSVCWLQWLLQQQCRGLVHIFLHIFILFITFKI